MQSEVEVDALVELEERIRRTVELVASLRSERDAALEELAAAQKSAADAKSKAEDGGAKLKAELDTLQSERKQVRTRIEKLLGQMDQLGS